MQRSTLASILDRLPLLLRNRYGGAADRFWVNKYNDLLGEMERYHTGPGNTVMVPVPWQTVSSNEVMLPHGVSDIIGVYRSTGGKISFEAAGSGVHLLEEVPTASQVLSINQVLGRRKQFGRDVILIYATNPVTQVGDGILIHGPQTGYAPGEYKPTDAVKASWVISQMAPNAGELDVSLPMEDGEYDWPILDLVASPSATDFYYSIRDFLIVEGHRAYHRISLSTDRTSLPPQWDSMVEAYLRFKGEVQTDQSSKDSQDWASLWQVELKKWLANQTKTASRAVKPTPSLKFTLASRR